ncbi:hypothetical protein ACLB1O_14985 [Escherichia coli]
MSWNDTLDERNSWSMSAGLQSDRPENSAADASGTIILKFKRVSGYFWYLCRQSSQFRQHSWSGSFTATQYGEHLIAALHRHLADGQHLMAWTYSQFRALDYTNHFGIAGAGPFPVISLPPWR